MGHISACNFYSRQASCKITLPNIKKIIHRRASAGAPGEHDSRNSSGRGTYEAIPSSVWRKAIEAELERAGGCLPWHVLRLRLSTSSQLQVVKRCGVSMSKSVACLSLSLSRES